MRAALSWVLVSACWRAPATPTSTALPQGGIHWVFFAGDRAIDVKAAFSAELDQHGIIGFVVDVQEPRVVVDIPGMTDRELTGATSLLIAAARNRARVTVTEESHVVFAPR